MAPCQHHTVLIKVAAACKTIRENQETHLKLLNENSQLDVLFSGELQMRGPSKRAWVDTNMQYTAPMTVITFRSDDRNIWKIKEEHWHVFLRVLVCFETQQHVWDPDQRLLVSSPHVVLGLKISV